MKVAALVSGGKDSVFAIQKMMADGYDVVCMACLVPKNPESYMFHAINTRLVADISEACGLPLLYQETSGVKEEELADMRSALFELKSRYGVSGVCTGAIESVYQKSRVERVCQELGLETFSPLWKNDPEWLLSEMIDIGMEIIFVTVAADGFDEHWLGRRLDHAALSDLLCLHRQSYVHVAGEGGEFETAVLDAPFFKKRIVPVKTRSRWMKNRGYFDILETQLVDKD
ncbi:diphthine--ammonia ligase [Methanolapillus millepedarum]|uniref:Diphthamide synthase domain-containing protein n=1 Tax=Methanolapillus millepedarum TaxID=3028296 RepID=A0AA96ZTW1_9EURY|nr:hypothetical protein MsAc7_05780 [Methanosarcinaceae archaeon Ac7]